MNFNPGKELINRQVILERMKVHAQRISLDAIAPLMYRTADLVQEFDRQLGRSYRLFAEMAKGETTTESRITTEAVTFEVFATWWDHLKYQFKAGKICWLPELWKRDIQVRYQKITKSVSVAHPISVIRACPHADISWNGDRQYVHIAYIHPTAWKEITE